MVCSCTNTWLLPFQYSDFCGVLTQAQYDKELENAGTRAYYIMSTPCNQATLKTWGIISTELSSDYSGQLQVSYELLASSEFLNRSLGYLQRINLLGEYDSPTQERIKKDVNSVNYYKNLSAELRDQAFYNAYDYICDSYKEGSAGVVSVNYNWDAINNDLKIKYGDSGTEYTFEGGCY